MRLLTVGPPVKVVQYHANTYGLWGLLLWCRCGPKWKLAESTTTEGDPRLGHIVLKPLQSPWMHSEPHGGCCIDSCSWPALIPGLLSFLSCFFCFVWLCQSQRNNRGTFFFPPCSSMILDTSCSDYFAFLFVSSFLLCSFYFIFMYFPFFLPCISPGLLTCACFVFRLQYTLVASYCLRKSPCQILQYAISVS